jgi:hypothetical protein
MGGVGFKAVHNYTPAFEVHEVYYFNISRIYFGVMNSNRIVQVKRRAIRQPQPAFYLTKTGQRKSSYAEIILLYWSVNA